MTKRFNRVKSTKETIHYNGIEDTEKEVIYNYGKQDDFLEDITQLLNELNDENEELKSTIKEVTELLVEEVDVFSEKATEHDINAYLELKELDNKDAFYMAISTKEAIKMLKELMIND